MQVQWLIESIVRQTTVLIAQIATTGGVRAPLGHIANRVFLNLVGELRQQGVGDKVIADMFGLLLRSFQKKMARLTASATDANRTLWEAVYAYAEERSVFSRDEILQRFRHDSERSVRGVLNDLVESGLLFKSGRRDAVSYRLVSADDRRLLSQPNENHLKEFLWVMIYRQGPLGEDDFEPLLPGVDETFLRTCLDQLHAEGRVLVDDHDGRKRYRSERWLLPLGSQAGWEAALFDHFQAVSQGIATKLRNGATRALPDDRVGGSTFAFDLCEGHPHANQVDSLLKETRVQLTELWNKVVQYNQANPRSEKDQRRVTFYVGQYELVDGETTHSCDEKGVE